jgi:hypothetical protein
MSLCWEQMTPASELPVPGPWRAPQPCRSLWAKAVFCRHASCSCIMLSSQQLGVFALCPTRYTSSLAHIIHLSCPASHRQTALEALQAWPGGLQLGGGVTTDNAMEYLDAGASHVIVTSFVFREGRLEEERLQQLVGGDVHGAKGLRAACHCARCSASNRSSLNGTWHRTMYAHRLTGACQHASCSCAKDLPYSTRT